MEICTLLYKFNLNVYSIRTNFFQDHDSLHPPKKKDRVDT